MTWRQPAYWFPPANQSPAIFYVPPGTEKPNKSAWGRLEAQIIPNMLHMFNNNIYTDFRTTCNESDLTEPKCHKTNHYRIGCLPAETGQDKQMKLSPQIHVSFYSFFHKKHSTHPRQIPVEEPR